MMLYVPAEEQQEQEAAVTESVTRQLLSAVTGKHHTLPAAITPSLPAIILLVIVIPLIPISAARQPPASADKDGLLKSPCTIELN